ncbi:transposase [Tardisphaera miroshnichenkoae]
MLKTLKVRLYPTDSQKVLLEKHFGACRFVWNYFLELRAKYYAEHKDDKKKGLTLFETLRMLTEIKRQYPWLNEVNSQSLQQSLRKLDIAFRAFFKRNSDYPNFRSKKEDQYFVIPQNFFIDGKRLIIPKFQEGIKFRDHAAMPEKIHEIVVTREGDRYYASIWYESYERPPKGSGVVGLDMGAAHFLVTSDGVAVEPLNAFKKFEKRLRKEHERLSRKKKGGKNRIKQVRRLRRVYQRVKDARNDFLHKVSTAIAKSYDTVIVEDLNVKGMVRNHRLAKSISDQGWYEFKQMLSYKLEERGAQLIKIGRFDPSSKLCSRCGAIKHDLKLSDRVFHCDVCGLTIDRDLNAAINILNIGLIKVGRDTPEFTPVEIPLAGYLRREGISYASLKQEPPILQGGEDVSVFMSS